MQIFKFFLFAFLIHPALGRATEMRDKYLDPFAASGEKIRLKLDSKRNSVVEAALLIDESCMAKHGRSHPALAKIKLPAQPLPSRKSSIETHKLLLTPGLMQQLDWMKQDPCILGVSENRPAFAESLPNDPYIERQAHLSALKYLPTFSFFSETTERDAVIAIIDTGIELTHEDLHVNLWTNSSEAAGISGIDDDGNGYVDDVHGYNFVSETGNPSHETANDHGTHVAGLAAASVGNATGVVGIAGNRARIMALNVFGKNWGTETVYIDRAIRYATDNGANVINISINGRGESDTTAAAIAYALNRGSLVVVSAGNNSEDISRQFTFPASYADRYPGLIAVGAIDPASKRICSFSNFSSTLVKVGAPGCDGSIPQNGIYSTRKQNLYGYKSGTSMAAPMAAGAVALAYLFAREDAGPNPSPRAVEDVFLNGSESVPELRGVFGSGRIVNLQNLMESIQN